MAESRHHQGMLDIALRALPVSRCPIDLFAINAVVQRQLFSTFIAEGIGDWFSIRQFMALDISMMVKVLEPSPNSALDALRWASGVGFLRGNQLAEGLLLG